MNNSKRRDLITAVLNPEQNPHPTEQKKESVIIDASILHQQQKYSEEDLPPLEEFVDLDAY